MMDLHKLWDKNAIEQHEKDMVEYFEKALGKYKQQKGSTFEVSTPIEDSQANYQILLEKAAVMVLNPDTPN